MPKHCRDTASSVILVSCLKIVAVVCVNRFVYQHNIHKFLSAWSENDMICFLVLVKIEQMVEGEFEKVGFQHKSKWRTGISAFYDIIGMYVVGMIQGII